MSWSSSWLTPTRSTLGWCSIRGTSPWPEDRGGTKQVPGPEVDQMKTPYFYPLGAGGVDFPVLKSYLDSILWRGFLNVELDTSPWRPPQESARISANYIENVLKIPL